MSSLADIFYVNGHGFVIAKLNGFLPVAIFIFTFRVFHQEHPMIEKAYETSNN